MEEYHQITLTEWMQWKEDIRQKLAETAQNFVYIGYRLKQIRDSGMFGGASDIFEFAQNEYGLGKSTVSRFIAINEKYSEGGNSLELKEQYRGFSSSKLSEMLTLPDSECELITEKTTVKDIRELKKFESQTVEDLQEAAGHEETEHTELETCIIDYFRGKKDMLNRTLRLYYDGKMKEAQECMNPSGNTTHKKGLCFLFMYEYERGIKYKLLTEPMPTSMKWDDFLSCIYGVFINLPFPYSEWEERDIYTEFYGEAVATSQQEISEVEPSHDEKPQEAAGFEEEQSSQIEETSQSEPDAKNEDAENKPFVEMPEAEKPVNVTVETTSEKIEIPEERTDTEKEEPENAESQETSRSEAVATSQQNQKDEIKNPAAFRNAKDARVRMNQAFEEGNYQRVLDMADAFIMHLERAIR
ncbi:MAG: hypothetical protein IKO76_07365 [Butyrivibrio sp.]|nr:hypothetical protein [Butyrivibrio sp.]